jgi:hypothetical protein
MSGFAGEFGEPISVAASGDSLPSLVEGVPKSSRERLTILHEMIVG